MPDQFKWSHVWRRCWTLRLSPIYCCSFIDNGEQFKNIPFGLIYRGFALFCAHFCWFRLRWIEEKMSKFYIILSDYDVECVVRWKATVEKMIKLSNWWPLYFELKRNLNRVSCESLHEAVKQLNIQWRTKKAFCGRLSLIVSREFRMNLSKNRLRFSMTNLLLLAVLA